MYYFAMYSYMYNDEDFVRNIITHGWGYKGFCLPRPPTDSHLYSLLTITNNIKEKCFDLDTSTKQSEDRA